MRPEQRRAPRKLVHDPALVIDLMDGKPRGRLGNLSATGMLIIGPEPPREEAIYQFHVPLPDPGRPPQYIEVGVQALWHDCNVGTGLSWSGYRIIAITEEDQARLQAWLALPGGQAATEATSG
ncbi:PilZ domain-containing protein [Aerosticca soli]|uniref:PilZ domain-containing protein n=1 Tax=Aerosticca soli TaxID=2010829 RepID=A0A2Z6E396_9GAMM|nr:PilZ domain-containing protein [Aerosticca soli]BBD79513.1 hypothetical protein ALSL_0848 [Aerosticca soli]